LKIVNKKPERFHIKDVLAKQLLAPEKIPKTKNSNVTT